jgi:tripartite ATP-independent transporter DctP family solute receptor
MTMMPISRRRFALGASAAATISLASKRRALAAAPVEMRQFHNQTEGSPLDKRLKEMWAAVERETGGKIRVKTYGGNDNIPGGDPQARGMLISGEIEFYTLMGGILDEVVPIADIQGMPFAFKDSQQVYSALDGDLGTLLQQEALTKGIYVVPGACFENGFRHITSSTHPIRTVADLRGMKLRVPASQMFADCFKSLGAEPISINTNKLYDALKTGMVEGQENPLAIADGFKLYEVQRYVSLTAHMWSGYNLLANLAVWRSLPAGVQDAIRRNAVKYVKLQRADNVALNMALVDGLAKRGMMFNTADTSGFRAPLGDFYRRWKEHLGAKAWAMLENHVGRLG